MRATLLAIILLLVLAEARRYEPHRHRHQHQDDYNEEDEEDDLDYDEDDDDSLEEDRRLYPSHRRRARYHHRPVYASRSHDRLNHRYRSKHRRRYDDEDHDSDEDTSYIRGPRRRYDEDYESYRSKHSRKRIPDRSRSRHWRYKIQDDREESARNRYRSRMINDSRSSSDEDNNNDDDDDEENLWSDEEEQELDNDFYKNDETSALRTYDDIIRKLTEDDRSDTPTTKPTNYLKAAPHVHHDPYGNLKIFDDHRKTIKTKKVKSLDEFDEDGTQADGIADYVDDENDDDEPSKAPTTTSTTTTTTTTTPTSTTTTQRPIPNNRYTGSQYNGYQTKNEYPPMTDISAYKWQHLGNREAVKETRGNMSQYSRNAAERKAALNHAMRVAKEGNCQWPRVKVIPVRDVYPNSTATYTPHCAILHRCSDDTGCCRSETLTCEAKQTHKVELYFYATYVNGKTETEKLTFTNHTECECRERKDFASTNDRLIDQRMPRHSSVAPQNIVRPERKSCQCPADFTPKITYEGTCECNCIDQDEFCFKFLRGKGYISNTNRLCIQNGKCTQPKCEYGEYMKYLGKCPMKKESIASSTSHRGHFNYRHRRS